MILTVTDLLNPLSVNTTGKKESRQLVIENDIKQEAKLSLG